MMQELLVGGGGGARVMEQCMVVGEQKKASPELVAADAQQAGLRCPRCDSTNTKFCYYNNYNLTQPRHFCKSCRRYWTQGGALRNVPIGGGCRKNKSSVGRSAKSKAEAASSTTTNSKNTTTTSTTTTTAPVTAATANSALSDHEPTSSSSTVTRSTSASILTPQTSSSISSFLQNSQFFESTQNYLGFLKPGNLNSSMVFQKSVSEAQNLEPLSAINGGGMWRNGNRQAPLFQHHHQQNQQVGLVTDQNGVFGSGGGGIQELYQRLRAMNSSGYGSLEQHHRVQPMLTGSWGLDSTSPLAVGDLGLWGAALPWSDLQSAAGASFP